MDELNKKLLETVKKLLSEHDNPVPDGMYRKVLRDQLKAIVAEIEGKPLTRAA